MLFEAIYFFVNILLGTGDKLLGNNNLLLEVCLFSKINIFPGILLLDQTPILSIYQYINFICIPIEERTPDLNTKIKDLTLR